MGALSFVIVATTMSLSITTEQNPTMPQGGSAAHYAFEFLQAFSPEWRQGLSEKVFGKSILILGMTELLQKHPAELSLQGVF